MIGSPAWRGDVTADVPRPGVRRRVLDWAWNHPRWKRRMREAWGIGREAAAAPAFRGPSILLNGRRFAASRPPRSRQNPAGSVCCS